MAEKMQLTHLAVTDHDTMASVAKATQAAIGTGVTVIPGVEISVTWLGRTIHVLGLNVDIHNAELLEGLRGLLKVRGDRAVKIAEGLEKVGVKQPLEHVKTFAKGELISRTHFAQVLIEQGFANNVKQVFKRYLVNKKPGAVEGDWAPLADAVSWITAAGGDAVIAHPARYKLTRTKLIQLIGDFKNAGGVGLEVVSSSHSSNEIHIFADLAVKQEMFASRGSDYHGLEGQWAKLGHIADLPKKCVPIWSKWGLETTPV